MSEITKDCKLVYFAGKVSPGGWRGRLAGDSRVMSEGYNKPVYTGECGKQIIYAGPMALYCDHGCSHGDGTHGVGLGDISACGGYSDKEGYKEVEGGLNHKQAIDSCFSDIKRSSAVVAYIETLDCYGTLVELGYAAAMNKRTILFVNTNLRTEISHPERGDGGVCLDDMWFVKKLPTVRRVICGEPSMEEIFFFVFPGLHKDRYHKYLKSTEWNQRRISKLKEAGFRCQVCNAKESLSVHHRTYDRVFHEEMSDLIALCGNCHQIFHGGQKGERLPDMRPTDGKFGNPSAGKGDLTGLFAEAFGEG